MTPAENAAAKLQDDPYEPRTKSAPAFVDDPYAVRPRGSARQLRKRVREAESTGEEFALLRELHRRRNTRKDRQ